MNPVRSKKSEISADLPTANRTSNGMKEVHSIVRGIVQIVMYRSFARNQAHRLGLKGFAKNLADGTVEVVAQGEEEKLKKFVAELHKGSIFSRVDEVKVSWRDPSEKFADFDIIL